MSGICNGRIAIVTGAGRGIGREHALELGRQGARVVVNDLGTSLSGDGTSTDPAEAVAEEIRAAGGEAVADGHDITDWEGAKSLVERAIDTWGGIDVVVNNAGIVRDRMFVSSEPEEWDAVLRVHLRGHFACARHAAAFWRAEAKAGRTPAARIINTSSGAGLRGSIGQSSYAAAKAGICALTLVQAAEMGRYGITANAIAPVARTRMTEEVFAEMMKKADEGFDAMNPANISPLIAWLASTESAHVTGRVFEVSGGEISIADGWREGSKVDRGERWDAAEIGDAMEYLLENTDPPEPVYGAS